MNRRPLFILGVVSLCALIAFAVHFSSGYSQDTDDGRAVVITVEDYSLTISRIWDTEEASRTTPERDVFLVLDVTLHNGSSSRACFHDRDFRADIGEHTDINPDDLRPVRDAFFPDRDFPGGFLGQCLDANTAEPSVLEYDVTVNPDRMTLHFRYDDHRSEVVLWLERQRDGQYDFGLESVEEGQAEYITYTPAPTATASLVPTTPAPSNTSRSSQTPRPSSTPAPTNTSEPETSTWYVESAVNVNVRACPGTDCEIVGSVAPSEQLTVLGTENDWHLILLPDGSEAYIAAWLTTQTRPAALAPVQPPALPGGQAATATQGPAQPAAPPTAPPTEPPATADPAFTCDCSKTCSAMTCEEAYFQLNQCGCSARDADGDGVPCESICPGG